MAAEVPQEVTSEVAQRWRQTSPTVLTTALVHRSDTSRLLQLTGVNRQNQHSGTEADSTVSLSSADIPGCHRCRNTFLKNFWSPEVLTLLMVKTHLLFMICVVSGFLLTLQLISLQILLRKVLTIGSRIALFNEFHGWRLEVIDANSDPNSLSY